jgi:hypothetical protein
MLGSDCFVEILTLTTHGERFFAEKLGMRGAQAVTGNLGAGTFSYGGLQGTDSPQVSIWEISVYGGLMLSGDDDGQSEPLRKIGAITGPRSITASAEHKAKWLSGLGASS